MRVSAFSSVRVTLQASLRNGYATVVNIIVLLAYSVFLWSSDKTSSLWLHDFLSFACALRNLVHPHIF
jgi:hypothetical protein